MYEAVRNLAIEWQRWSSETLLSYGELAEWQNAISLLASAVDDGKLLEELEENGII